MVEYPIITIITPTYNNEKKLEFFFRMLNKQNYPKKYLQYLCVDGGSTDKTAAIASKYHAQIINNPYKLAEAGVSIGLSKVKTGLAMILAADNYFIDKDAIKKIATVFKDKNIYAAFPKHDSDKKFSIFSKYHNTFTDPFNHFVYGNAANTRTFHRLYKTIFHSKIYDIYDFKSNKVIPILAFAQGFTIRSSYKKKAVDFFDDIKPIIDLIKDNKIFAYVYSVSIYHNTISNMWHFIRKIRWATQNALENKKYGINYRMNNLSRWQKIKVKLWPIYAFSFIFPFLWSIRGVIEDRDFIWLLHPINCFLAACASLYQVIIYNIGKSSNIKRQ